MPEFAPPGGNAYVAPLHYEASGLCQTGCVHCARCGLGPQTHLSYRYESPEIGVGYSVTTISNGLCPRCAAS